MGFFLADIRCEFHLAEYKLHEYSGFRCYGLAKMILSDRKKIQNGVDEL
jgi:hypothetical protein